MEDSSSRRTVIHSGPAIPPHPTHGMSPSVYLESEKFLALCDPMETKNVRIFPLNPLLILFLGQAKTSVGRQV